MKDELEKLISEVSENDWITEKCAVRQLIKKAFNLGLEEAAGIAEDYAKTECMCCSESAARVAAAIREAKEK